MATENGSFYSGVIEVPPELRGPSNEEILQMSEREDTERRRRAAARPSKRERMRRKMNKELAAMSKIGSGAVRETMAQGAPIQHMSAKSGNAADSSQTGAKAAPKHSFARKKLESLFSAAFRRERPAEPTPVEAPVKKEPKFTPPSVPASGRVLRGSFGAKPSDEAKAKVYSVAELERLRMEERAKKIRAELARKNKPAAPALAEDGTPVKRPRGRPRKNPLPEQL